MIPAVPRRIFKSKEFECPEDYVKALSEIENRITSGQSLTKFMSDKILELGNKDLMLYDWNIHHLHLSRRERDDGFVRRSHYELFVFFTNEVAYFIQVYPHNYSYLYSTKDMVEIVHNNWPELISKYKINGVLSCKITNEQRELLRKAGITTPVETGNGKGN